MKLTQEKMEMIVLGDLLMSVSMRTELKAYFEALHDLTGNDKYLTAFDELREYTRIAPTELIYDPSCPCVDSFEGICVGEMLCVASNLLEHRTSPFSQESVPPLEMEQMGRHIMHKVLFAPYADIKAMNPTTRRR